MQGFKPEGLVLDIGGGGEGIIGRLLGKQVVAIDRRKDELEEAPDGPLKVVADAMALPFLDETFDHATVFFTFFYIPDDQRQKVLDEVARVLKKDGNLYIWDAIIPPYNGGEKDVFATELSIELGDETVATGYGTLWEGKAMSDRTMLDHAQKAGFELVDQRKSDEQFYLQLVKSITEVS